MLFLRSRKINRGKVSNTCGRTTSSYSKFIGKKKRCGYWIFPNLLFTAWLLFSTQISINRKFNAFFFSFLSVFCPLDYYNMRGNVEEESQERQIGKISKEKTLSINIIAVQLDYAINAFSEAARKIHKKINNIDKNK